MFHLYFFHNFQCNKISSEKKQIKSHVNIFSQPFVLHQTFKSKIKQIQIHEYWSLATKTRESFNLIFQEKLCNLKINTKFQEFNLINFTIKISQN